MPNSDVKICPNYLGPAEADLPASSYEDNQMLKRTARTAILLAAIAIAAPEQASAIDCRHWNQDNFFSYATADRVRECLDNGADPNGRDDFGWPRLDRAVEVSGRQLSASPLPLRERFVVVLILIAAGADVNAQSEDGWQALHIAAKGNKFIH